MDFLKVLGIVAEYNPFHNGHKYHLEEAKKITNSDYVIAIMSGSFTELGNIAIYDKFTRAKLAIENGVDMVIELPTIYANSSAEYFSSAAINLLDKLGIVDSVCFGAETDNIQDLNTIADIFINNEDTIWEKIRENLKTGISMAKSRQIALEGYLDKNLRNIISKPNNILGIEYLKALKKIQSNIAPYIIERNSVNHNAIDTTNNSIYASATYIRKEIQDGNVENIKNYVPENTYNIISSNKPTYNEDMFSLLRYKINSMDVNELKNIFEVTEGLENKIIKANNISTSYEELVKNIKSKRYVESKIRRILVNILLDITKDLYTHNISYNNLYAHVLAISDNGSNILSNISRTSSIPVITSISEAKLSSLVDKDIESLLKLDILASNVYSLVNNENLNKDYMNKLKG